jgi:hypothetical protein
MFAEHMLFHHSFRLREQDGHEYSYHDYKGYVQNVSPPPSELEQLTSVTTRRIQTMSRAAGRGLVNSLLLDMLDTGIYLGGI